MRCRVRSGYQVEIRSNERTPSSSTPVLPSSFILIVFVLSHCLKGIQSDILVAHIRSLTTVDSLG